MIRTTVDIFEGSFQRYSESVAMRWREEGKTEFTERTYRELCNEVDIISAGLLSMGLKPKSHIGLIEDVSQNWTTSSIAIQMIGCIDVPRGTDSTGPEIAFIFAHSQSKIAFVANAKKVDEIELSLKKEKHDVSKYILLDNSVSKKNSKKCIKLSEVSRKGEAFLKKESGRKTLTDIRKKVAPSDLCTIIYTSGTTGQPKGVQLTHANLTSQGHILTATVDISTADRALTLLPPWHIFGRITELLVLLNGASLTYTNIKSIKDDMRNTKPTIIPAVPRIWEAIYDGLIGKLRKGGKLGLFNFFKRFAVINYKSQVCFLGQEKLYKKRNCLLDLFVRLIALVTYSVTLPLKGLGHILIFSKIIAATGGSLRFSISGGGALLGYVDDFFAAIGLKILEGYGLTETSPVLSIRQPDKVVLGTVGPFIDQTEFKLIDYDGHDVTRMPGAKGTLHVRGPQIMQGYYKNPKKTKEVLTSDGWFNTGDLVILTYDKQVTIVGRSKDTIVLRGGENVEPAPIEEKVKESSYISNAMCVGQDEKTIGVLIVPNEENLVLFAKSNGLPSEDIKSLLVNSEINALYRSEISKFISTEAGFKSFEKIVHFRLLEKPFEKGDELNNTFKIVRHLVREKYKKIIQEMYK